MLWQRLIYKNVFDMRKKYTLFLSLFAFVICKVAAVAPTWTVNPGSFQYNMTMVAIAEINCVELQNTNNRIGVFVGGQCRGTAFTSQVINGRFTASLFIYSNLVQGENLSFMVYNAAMDSVFALPNTIAFLQNASFGTSTVPHILRNNNPPTNISLSAQSFNENVSANTLIASLSATDPDVGNTFVYSLVTGSEPNDNANFSVQGSNLRIQNPFDFETQSTANIRLRVTDNFGCSFDKNFQLQVNNVNEAPFAVSMNDSVINENLPAGTLVGILSASDPDANQTFSYSFATGLGDSNNTAFSLVGNELRTTQSFNFEAKSSYGIRIRVRDAGNLFYERALVILVRDVNDIPSALLINGSNTTTSFAENRGIGSFVANLSTSDEDANSSFSYSFISTGGNDNSSFQIVGNQLRANMAFDFETRQVYSVFIQSSDGMGGTIARQFLLNVTDSNDAPTSIGLSSLAVQENKPVGTFLAKLSSIDPDASQSVFTYSLVSGAGSSGNIQFFISQDSLYTAAIFDFETLASYNIRVRTVDIFNASFEQNFTIQILNANDAPSDISLSNNQVNENVNLATAIGNLSAQDQDVTSNFSYTLVPGVGATDNALFNIVGNSVRTNTLLNFELKNIYSIRIRVNDGFNGIFEKAFTIQVLDVNDAPNNILISNQSVTENRVSNSIIGVLNTVDEDNLNTFTYSFEPISGNDNASFVISGNSLRTLSPLDFEVKNIYFVYIKTNDGAGGTFVKQFQISVLDSNDAPTNIILNSPTISENQGVNSFIGTFLPVDQDATGSYIYSLVSGNGSTDNASFFIRNDSLFNAQSLNFELKNTYSIRVRCSNSGLLFEKAIVLNVQNGNDAPTDILLGNTNILENLPVNSLVGSFSSIDEDTGEVHTYALVPGIGSTHNQKFAIVGNQLRTLESFNFEAQKTYSIRVLTNDGNGGSFSKAFTISVIDANDNPTQISISNAMVTENLSVNAIVGLLNTTDQDSADTHTYSFLNQGANNNDKFLISGNELRTNGSFDFETKSSYLVNIQTNDGRGGTFTRQLLIQIKDTNDAPYGLSLDNISIEENLPARTFIGIFRTADYDVTGSYTYSFVAGAGSAANTRFLIVGDSLFSNNMFDFESESQLSIRVRTTDNGGFSLEQSFSVQILNRNDNPTLITLSNKTITENLPNRSLVGLLSSVDQDANNIFSYTLVSGTGDTDNASFAILGNELRSNIRFNFETKSSYSIRIRTNDGFGGTFESAFTINIIDSSDAPTNIILSKDNITENRQLGSLIGALTSIDEDISDQFTYSFFQGASHNNDQFILVNNELRAGKSFDFENKNFYIVYIQTTDKAGLSFVKQFVINVNDSNDVPTNLFLNNQSISENQPIKSYLGTLSTIDAEIATSFTYTFVGGSGAVDNVLFSISNDSVYTNTLLNFEQKASLSIRLRTTDVGGAYFDKSFQIQVTNANDAPSDILLNNNTVMENEPLGSPIGSLSAIDEDASETFEYTFAVGSGDMDNAAFKLIGANLVSNEIFNYENKTLYSVRISVKDKQGATFEKIFVINVSDVIEAPTFDSDTFSVSESSLIGFVVGTIAASSQDANANLNYEWASSGNLPFILNSQSGAITVAQKLDYESQKLYNLQVKITDLRKPDLAIIRPIYIQISDELEANMALPASNVISPDGDGYNDFFTIDNVDLYTDFTLTIYNSSGVVVYKSLNNYQNNWAGTYQDQTLPKGVYFYVFSNKITEFKGSITLLR